MTFTLFIVIQAVQYNNGIFQEISRLNVDFTEKINTYNKYTYYPILLGKNLF